MNVIYFKRARIFSSFYISINSLQKMKRSRSESPITGSSSSDDNSDVDSSTISSRNSSESEEHSPKPDYTKGNDRNSSIGTRKSGTTSSSSSSSQRTTSSIATSPTKSSKHFSGKISQIKSQSVSKKIKSGNSSLASPTKGLKTALPKKKQIIEVIDFSTSEYSPSDDEEYGTESSSSSESENEKYQTKETLYKKAENVVKGEKSPKVGRKPKSGKIHDQKHTIHSQKGEGKRFSLEEDAAIIAYIESIVRTVDLMKHLRETFPDQPPRARTSVQSRRASLFDKWKDLILSTEASKRH